MQITTIIAAVAAAVISSTFVASAVSAEPVRSEVRVSYADLNLTSVKGQMTLAQRIETAAASICGVNPNERDHAMKANSDRCFAAAVSRANLAVASADTLVLASR